MPLAIHHTHVCTEGLYYMYMRGMLLMGESQGLTPSSVYGDDI